MVFLAIVLPAYKQLFTLSVLKQKLFRKIDVYGPARILYLFCARQAVLLLEHKSNHRRFDKDNLQIKTFKAF